MTTTNPFAPLPERDRWMAPALGESSCSPEVREERWPVPDPEAPSNLIGSTVGATLDHDGRGYLTGEGCERVLHMPVLDIDVPARLVPSETPGHHHLYIDVPMTWDHYKAIIEALGAAGVLEPGYVSASLARRCTFVSPVPWKEKAEDAAAIKAIEERAHDTISMDEAIANVWGGKK